MNYIEQRREALGDRTKDALVDELINRDLNGLVGRYADFENDDGDVEADPYGHGKRVPYIGWFWREVDFANGVYVIGACSEYIGFMENNKWGYPQRRLIPSEAAQVTEIVCAAYERNHAGGNLAEIIANTKAKLAELWPVLQSFSMEVEGFWINGPVGNIAFAETEEEADTLIASLQSANLPGCGFTYEKVRA